MSDTNMKRRTLLKGAMSAGMLSVAAGAGLLNARAVLAAYPEAAFKPQGSDVTMDALGGAGDASGDIKIKAPDIAENGAVVPITVSTGMSGVTSIAILASNNAVPLAAQFNLGAGSHGYCSTRIKMGKTADVIAVVTAGGKNYHAKKSVKVTIGGCGG